MLFENNGRSIQNELSLLLVVVGTGDRAVDARGAQLSGMLSQSRNVLALMDALFTVASAVAPDAAIAAAASVLAASPWYLQNDFRRRGLGK